MRDSYEIIHVACHGLNPGSFDGVYFPSLVLSNIKDGEENDGLIDAQEIFELDLQNRLVVLSACETLLSNGSSNNSWGLGATFVHSGVGSVIATMWNIESHSTVYFMSEFYKYLKSTNGQ